MSTSSKAEYFTSIASATDDATPSSSLFFSPRIELSIVEQIEHSKADWSQLVEYETDEDEVAEISNVNVFKALQEHPTWGTFFKTNGKGEDDLFELEVGKMFAKGGQAELYEAQVKWREQVLCEHVQTYGTKFALKVFEKGTFLKRLQTQWPKGMLQFYAEKVETRFSGTSKYGPRYFCDVVCATLLEDGRFAFLLVREKGDLRSVINNMMSYKVGGGSGPFPKEVARRIMYEVAKGMQLLHGRGIIHRDLKASNVLVSQNFNYIVADYECSIGVVGTGFFRAPEILQAIEEENVNERLGLFTKESDVYSYGMLCYEVLTGKHPFEGHNLRDYGCVLKGQRPEVPKYVDDSERDLLNKCWQANPASRPSFDEVLELFTLMKEGSEVILNQPAQAKSMSNLMEIEDKSDPMEQDIKKKQQSIRFKKKQWSIRASSKWLVSKSCMPLKWFVSKCCMPCFMPILRVSKARDVHFLTFPGDGDLIFGEDRRLELVRI